MKPQKKPKKKFVPRYVLRVSHFATHTQELQEDAEGKQRVVRIPHKLHQMIERAQKKRERTAKKEEFVPKIEEEAAAWLHKGYPISTAIIMLVFLIVGIGYLLS